MPATPTGRQGLTTSTANTVKNLATRGTLPTDAVLTEDITRGRKLRMQVYPLVNGSGQDIVVYVGFDSNTSASNYVHAYRPGDIWIEESDDSPRHGVDLRSWYFNPNTNDCGFTWGVD